ncbi:hypothetical protein HBI81_165990 [Parastagonospora nodorum]|nr:hypothetical protein HBH53_225530 [Parastagonospora nodorum]KAH3967392.1 hypothetical protein HBH52_189340 [Parastagonospora nodorum]KAH3994084.1 hypothetical protein HBI10_194460 [Parastagonospora nodorum]KAH4008698.1 hypothetical protein HBI13_231510 [Parastagonospora nodorum]KAH4045111.1 hypothetical protein HBH49_205030 [Parastagonospora nodorum]
MSLWSLLDFIAATSIYCASICVSSFRRNVLIAPYATTWLEALRGRARTLGDQNVVRNTVDGWSIQIDVYIFLPTTSEPGSESWNTGIRVSTILPRCSYVGFPAGKQTFSTRRAQATDSLE